MKLDFTNERVLAVVAHPDDAELLCVGTLARARSQGAAIGICVLCRGDKGQPSRPVVNLASVRRREMAASARLLGAQLFQGGFPDGTLLDGVTQRRRLAGIYRQFKPWCWPMPPRITIPIIAPPPRWRRPLPGSAPRAGTRPVPQPWRRRRSFGGWTV